MLYFICIARNENIYMEMEIKGAAFKFNENSYKFYSVCALLHSLHRIDSIQKQENQFQMHSIG